MIAMKMDQDQCDEIEILGDQGWEDGRIGRNRWIWRSVDCGSWYSGIGGSRLVIGGSARGGSGIEGSGIWVQGIGESVDLGSRIEVLGDRDQGYGDW